MIVSKEEVINVFASAYDKDEEATKIKKEVQEDLQMYAEDNDLNLKSVKQVYALYKKYRNGSVPSDDDTYFELMAAVEEHFATETQE